MLVRSNSLLAGDDRPDHWASGYQVVVYPAGAISSGTYTGKTPSVFRGHSFRIGDYALIMRGSQSLQAGQVTAAGSTSLTFPADVSVIYGDKIVNLGQDPGYSYTKSPMRIFAVPGDDSTPIEDAYINVSQRGRYTYGYYGAGRAWELILDASGIPIDVVTGFESSDSRINVVDFGVRGDDSTDDGIRLNAVTSAIPTEGAEVVIPYGKYRIGTRWDIKKSNVTIRFDGGAKFLVHDSVTSGIKLISMAGGVSRISGITILQAVMEDENAAIHSNPAEQTHGIVIEEADDVTIRGFHGKGFGDEAINLIDCNHFNVTECHFDECSKEANSGNITLTLCQHGRVTRCSSKNSANGAGIRVECTVGGGDIINNRSAHIVIANNSIESPLQGAEGGGDGIMINAGSNNAEHISIVGNTISSPAKHGITLIAFANTRVDHCTIIGNVVEGGGGSVPGNPAREGAIDLDTNVRYSNVHGNVVEGWGDGTTFTHGIRVKAGGGSITGNTLRNLNNDSGVAIYSDASAGPGSFIQGNVAIGGTTFAANDMTGADPTNNNEVDAEPAEV